MSDTETELTREGATKAIIYTLLAVNNTQYRTGEQLEADTEKVVEKFKTPVPDWRVEVDMGPQPCSLEELQQKIAEGIDDPE